MRRCSTRSMLCASLALAAWGCADSDSEPAPSGGGASRTDPTARGGASTAEPTARDGASTAEPSAGGGASTAEPTAGGESSPTDPATLEWQTLLTGDWTIPAGTEDYVCVRHTITEDIYVRALDAINPPGTHHTFLTMGPQSGPDGVTACTFTENHAEAIFGSGVGTNPIQFPQGVAVKLSAGTQLLLNLHLFNPTDNDLSGTSGTRVASVEAGEVEHLGKALTVGTTNLNIPARQDTTHGGSCTISADTTVFALLPHMHQLGIHMKVTAQSSIDGERVLHDGPYDFDSQLYYAIDPIQLAQGDTVQFECTWRNTTDRTVMFGDGSLDEMCTAGLYRYPAAGSDFCFGR